MSVFLTGCQWQSAWRYHLKLVLSLVVCYVWTEHWLISPENGQVEGLNRKWVKSLKDLQKVWGTNAQHHIKRTQECLAVRWLSWHNANYRWCIWFVFNNVFTYCIYSITTLDALIHWLCSWWWRRVAVLTSANIHPLLSKSCKFCQSKLT